jgi:hypothetical protein
VAPDVRADRALAVSRGRVSDTERIVVLALLILFAALAAAEYVRDLVDPMFDPDATLTTIAVGIVGAATTHLLIGRRGGGRDDEPR